MSGSPKIIQSNPEYEKDEYTANFDLLLLPLLLMGSL